MYNHWTKCAECHETKDCVQVSVTDWDRRDWRRVAMCCVSCIEAAKELRSVESAILRTVMEHPGIRTPEILQRLDAQADDEVVVEAFRELQTDKAITWRKPIRMLWFPGDIAADYLDWLESSIECEVDG